MRPDGSPAPAVSNDSFDTPRPSPRPARLRWLAALWCAAAAATAGADTCGPSRVDARAHVAYVYDGDTVRLDDGRHIRLIGIDTPEIGHHGKPSQPFAVAARKALIRLLDAHGNRVALAYGREHFDKYHRVLAHVYVDGRRSVEARLLTRGLAVLLVVPPNVGHAACYAAAERAARDRRRGIWHHPKYQVTPVARLAEDSRGYHIISGRVTRIAHSAHAVWVHLGPKVELRIDKRDLPYLKPLDPDTLLHRRVIARGWLHAHRHGGLWMRVRHHSALGPAPP